ncbi:MAG: hypothetical protein ABJL99_12400 [Aliishimia sp.]
MIRAITYTVLFCGISAGAAVALAVAHDARNDITPIRAVISKPALMEPESTDVQAPLASIAEPIAYEPAPTLAIIEQPVLPTVTQIENLEPRKITVAPKAVKRKAAPKVTAVVSTRNSLEVTQRRASTPEANGIEMARNVTAFAPRKTRKPMDIGSTWATGVFR